MAVSGNDGAAEAPLLEEEMVEGTVDYKGQKARRSSTGGWRSAGFIIGVEIAERFVFYGIICNLITYLTGHLGQSTATAAKNVNAWSGVATLTPLLGAFIADSYLGRYQTILYSSLLYVLGLGLLTISVTITPSNSTLCGNNGTSSTCPSQFQKFFFFTSLYLVAIAVGGHKPCTQAFGADQFDGHYQEESKSKSSFFNWWYLGMCSGIGVSILILSYIQDNLGWSLGIGIPCITMVLALVVFVLGTKTYRYSTSGENGRSPFVRIARVFIAAAKNWRSSTAFPLTAQDEENTTITSSLLSNKFRFLDKALRAKSHHNQDCSELKDWTLCSASQVNEAKAVLQLAPIWCTCIAYAVAFAQPPTLFTKQGSTMDRKIGSNFQIPSASIQAFTAVSIIFVMPIYDRIFVPIARAFTNKPYGITTLQRIGFGMLIYTVAMALAAVVEKKRLDIARNYGLVENPEATVPMSIWWLVPQYLICGVSDAFAVVGLQEFFYDQVPDELRSIGAALYLSIFGIGSFISGFIISVIDKVTSKNGGDSWISTNLNKGHLDYFYWLLAALNLVGLIGFVYFAKSYIYRR
ncbi:hypothetical protein Syun_003040 [Stephania yunnanensis]|uniref:Protein NRT1/ PTR FAMILY 5.10-like n=1 Tax=Stephania yunnanensis TaxID=152371 RepID=A0AAP0L202_9MAGN